MLTLIFLIGLLWMIWKIVALGLALTWGVIKFALTTALFPLILIGLFIIGLAYVALPIAIIVGIIALIMRKTSAE